MIGPDVIAASGALPTQQAGQAPSAGSSSGGGNGGLSSLGGDAFMNLLVAQMRYQNPFGDKQDPSKMLQQTAQFTQVETMTRLAESQQQVKGLAQASLGAEMLGKEVTAVSGEDGEVTGTVDGLRFSDQGPVLSVEGSEVALSSVTSVGEVATGGGSDSSGDQATTGGSNTA